MLNAQTGCWGSWGGPTASSWTCSSLWTSWHFCCSGSAPSHWFSWWVVSVGAGMCADLFVTLHIYILTAAGLGNDRRWTQSLLWLETKWGFQGASWEYSSSKGGQFIKHCKSAKLPWNRNIKLSHVFLVFCCLIVFLSFHFFVFLLAKCWKKLNEKKKLI